MKGIEWDIAEVCLTGLAELHGSNGRNSIFTFFILHLLGCAVEKIALRMGKNHDAEVQSSSSKQLPK